MANDSAIAPATIAFEILSRMSHLETPAFRSEPSLTEQLRADLRFSKGCACVSLKIYHAGKIVPQGTVRSACALQIRMCAFAETASRTSADIAAGPPAHSRDRPSPSRRNPAPDRRCAGPRRDTTGGTIAIGNGNLTFSGGNTALGDIVVNGGKGTAFNDDPLMIAATWAMPAIGGLGLGRAKTEEGVGEIGLGQRFCQLRFRRWRVSNRAIRLSHILKALTGSPSCPLIEPCVWLRTLIFGACSRVPAISCWRLKQTAALPEHLSNDVHGSGPPI
jgi:hypothetical protein